MVLDCIYRAYSLCSEAYHGDHLRSDGGPARDCDNNSWRRTSRRARRARRDGSRVGFGGTGLSSPPVVAVTLVSPSAAAPPGTRPGTSGRRCPVFQIIHERCV